MSEYRKYRVLEKKTGLPPIQSPFFTVKYILFPDGYIYECFNGDGEYIIECSNMDLYVEFYD